MSAVKISALLVVFCFLFIAIPCYAAEWVPYGQTHELGLARVSEANADSVVGNLEAIGNETQLGNGSEPAGATGPIYSIVAGISNPTINPGDPIKISVYLSGDGIAEKYKLMVIWPYQNIIDEKEGNIRYLDIVKISDGNVTFKFTPKALVDGNVTGATGAWCVPSNLIFASVPTSVQPDFPENIGLRMVMGEFSWDGNPPILIELKTGNKAEAGDYLVGLTFTYGNETNVKQSSTSVEFHIRSMWWWGIPRETWQFGAGIFAAVTGWLALIRRPLGTILGIICRSVTGGLTFIIRASRKLYRKWRQGSQGRKRKGRPKRSG